MGSRNDTLTGLMNNEAFYEVVRKILDAEGDEEFSLVLFDVHRFKMINDIFGEATGDRILKLISREIISKISTDGICSRLEADHFAVLLPTDKLDISGISKLAAECVDDIDIEWEIDIYIGVYEIDEKNIPVSVMCDRANIAIQTVKGSYIKKYAVYDHSLRDEILERMQLINDARRAIDEDQFFFELQPVWSISEGRISSAEMLIRWRHPVRGVLMPEQFLFIFEENGFITRLEEHIWDKLCRTISELQENGQQLVPVSVNVSRRDFYDPELPHILLGLVEKYNIDTSMLRVEILERAYTEEPAGMSKVVRNLQHYGFRVMMDDFGSERSSLSMLKDIPVDILKIDRTFIDEIETSDRACSMLSNIMRMARWMEITVIAEGVETRSQLDFLRGIGCDLIQGFYYYRPLLPDEFSDLLRENAEQTGQNEVQAVSSDVNMQHIMDEVHDFNDTMELFSCGAALYELTDGRLEVIQVNDVYYEIIGSTPKEYFRSNKDEMAWIHKADRAKLLEACYKAAEDGECKNILVRRYHSSGKLMWMYIKIKYLGASGSGLLLCFLADDITEQYSDDMSEQFMIALDGVSGYVNPGLDASKTADKAAKAEPDKKTVLVVDDNSINRKMIRRILSEEYNIIEAENGREAIECIRDGSSRIDAILLDIIMPVMSGMEFLEVRKKDRRMLAIPVIVLTQAETREEEKKALEMGASDFLRKPYEFDIIKQRLTNLIALAEAVSYKMSMESIINALPGGVIVFEKYGGELKVQFLNQGMAGLTGYTVQEYTRKYAVGLERIIYEEDRADVLAALENLKTGIVRSTECEYRHMTRSGDIRWAFMQVSFVYREDDPHVYYAVISDITRLKQIEAEMSEQKDELEKSYEKYKLAMTQSDLDMWEYDIRNDELHFTEEEADKFGIPARVKDASRHHEIFTGYSQKEISRYEALFRAMKEGRSPVKTSYTYRDRSGADRYVSVTYTTLYDSAGAPIVAIGTGNDITETVETDIKYRQELSYKKHTTRDAAVSLQFDLESGERIPSEVDIVPYGFEDSSEHLLPFLKKYIQTRVHADDRAKINQYTDDPSGFAGIMIEKESISEEVRVLFAGRSGSEYRWCRLEINAMNDAAADNNIAAGSAAADDHLVMITVRDIHVAKISELRLKEMAMRDSLTGLYGRETFKKYVNRSLQEDRKQKRISAFLILDIDDFKNINDTYGHRCGDDILKHLGARLKAMFRSGDIVGRLGGDEMVMYMANISDWRQAEQKGIEVCSLMSEWRHDEIPISVSCSTGVDIVVNGGKTFDELYKNADQALYQAKKAGKGKCCVYGRINCG